VTCTGNVLNCSQIELIKVIIETMAQFMAAGWTHKGG